MQRLLPAVVKMKTFLKKDSSWALKFASELDNTQRLLCATYCVIQISHLIVPESHERIDIIGPIPQKGKLRFFKVL